MVRWKSVSNAATSGISGNCSPSNRIAAMYGGLWAGATWFISAIAASTSASTRWTPLIRPPCTALKAMADTSAALPRQPSSGSVNWARHCRTASAWSGTRAAVSRRRPPISTTHGLSGEPIRSTARAQAGSRRPCRTAGT